ncbi:serine endoprotease [Rubripirellula obstinata]|uniref:Serine endoprotease n=1 Tax=Rubripirellula obstinata TaxID=406547 RepID=A0A5B1CJ36_9BACT|nr:PDZ domain-containing protein [Rubripirellula obstinata]KAA1261177.1 serine endoprotease [Rubripirellula obstinata]
MTYQPIKTHRRSLRKLLSTAALASLTLCFVASTATAQDSVRDRLSPGNGPDWAGEPNAETNGYAGGESQSQPQAGSQITRPGPDQPWFRGNDGRFFYRDEAGNSVYEDQVYGPRTANRNRNGLAINQRPVLGVALSDTPSGVQVSAVQPGSAAEQAGIRTGDIINRVNDQDATSSEDFVNRVGQMNAGDPLVMDYTRNGQQQRANATLGSATMQDELYRSARPIWDGMMRNRGSMNMNQFRRDFDDLRRQVDDLSQRFNTFSDGSAAKQVTE